MSHRSRSHTVTRVVRLYRPDPLAGEIFLPNVQRYPSNFIQNPPF